MTSGGTEARVDHEPLPPVHPHGGRVERALACIFFEASGLEDVAWTPGPLPLVLPDGRRADAVLRASYFRPRAASVLYGTDGGRKHIVVDCRGPAGSTLAAVEALRVPDWGLSCDPSWLVALHFTLPVASAAEALSALVDLQAETDRGRAVRVLVAEGVSAGIRISPEWRRAQSIALVQLRAGQQPVEGAPQEWGVETSWLWAMASATPYASFKPDIEDPHLLDGLLFLSTAWRGLALRDGTAFVVSQNDEGRRFADSAAAYVRTIYADVLLLSVLQSRSLDGFADRLSATGSRFTKASELRDLVNAVTEYRNVLWWEDVTQHGIANQLLRTLHHARHTRALLERVTADLTAFHEQVETQATQDLRASQEAEERRSQRFERFASFAAISFGLPVFVFTAMALHMQGLSAGYPVWLVVSLGVGLPLAGCVGMIAVVWRAGLRQARIHSRNQLRAPMDGKF